ncbi:MAG: ArsR family transcriptional regulator [Spirochaetes bacterium]|nr:ArsR family transcriptional regulator [Spirochaetota bacterium]
MEDRSIFREIMGDSPRNRILDFLITFKDYDYSMSDIAENSGVGWSTLNLFWKDLEKYEIVKFTRNVGKAKMYKLNDSNPIVKKIMEMHWTIIKNQTHEQQKVSIEQ